MGQLPKKSGISKRDGLSGNSLLRYMPNGKGWYRRGGLPALGGQVERPFPDG